MEPTGRKIEDLELRELIAMRTQVETEMERRRREEIIEHGGFICRDCGQLVPVMVLSALPRDIRIDAKKHTLCPDCRLRRRCQESQRTVKSLVGKTVVIEEAPFDYYTEHGAIARAVIVYCEEIDTRFRIAGSPEGEQDGDCDVTFEIMPGDKSVKE
jgi:hypothetical protein